MSKISAQGLCKGYMPPLAATIPSHTNCDHPRRLCWFYLLPISPTTCTPFLFSRRTTVVQLLSLCNCLALRGATCPTSLVLQNQISSSTASRPSCSVPAGLSDVFCFLCPRALASPPLLLRLRPYEPQNHIRPRSVLLH